MKTRHWSNWGIAVRLIVLAVVPVALLFIAGVIYTYHTRMAEVTQDLAEHGLIIATTLAEGSGYGMATGNFDDLDRIAKTLVKADKAVIELDILNTDKQVVLQLASVPDRIDSGSRSFYAPIKKQPVNANTFEIDGLPHVAGDSYTAQPSDNATVGYIRVRLSSKGLIAKHTNQLFAEAALLFFAFLVSLLCALYLAQKLRKPLVTAVNALREIRSGNYSVSVEVSTGGEIGYLLRSINSMAESLTEAKSDLEGKVCARTAELEASQKNTMKANNEKRQLIRKMESVVEDERKSISVEIHDELNAMLLAVRLNSQQIIDMAHGEASAQNNREISDRAQSMLKITTSLYTTARNIVRRLRPEVLDILGLQGAAADLVHNFEILHPKCQVVFDSSGDFEKVEPDLAITAYRLIQEALSNVTKHTTASQVFVSVAVEETDNTLHISITDNGIGFDTENSSSGFGILGMRERVLAFNGQIEITSQFGIGTVVSIQIGLNQESRDRLGRTHDRRRHNRDR